MALYETLIEGGHEHLIDAVKARIAQKADAIIEDELKPIIENQPSATLEGELLVAEDAADLPPMNVVVDGNSGQARTTGKNLLPPTADYYTVRSVDGTNRRTFAIEVSDGESLHYHRTNQAIDFGIGFCDELDSSITLSDTASMTGQSNKTITNTNNHAYLIVSFSTSYNMSVVAQRQGIIERGASYTSYEPYTGGKPSPSPSYPQQIESITELALVFAKKNILDKSTSVDGYIDSSTGAVLSGTKSKTTDYIAVQPSDSYQFSTNAATLESEGSRSIAYYDALKVCVGITNYTSSVSGNNVTLSVPSNAAYVRIAYDVNVTEPQLEHGTTTTAYEPYAGTTVQLYDGTLRSLPNGTKDTMALTYLRPSTRAGWAWYSRELVQRISTVDLGTLTWTKYTLSFMSSRVSGMRHVTAGIVAVLCDSYAATATSSSAPSGDNVIRAQLNYNQIQVFDSSAIEQYDAAGFKAAVNGVIAQYPLATPITTTLDPIELPVLPAPNCTVWSSPTTGLKLTYVIDSETIEESLESGIGKAFSSVAPVETSPATDSHGVGSRIVYNETLYKVTSAIAAGEDIVPGTNVTATTVAAELLATQA